MYYDDKWLGQKRNICQKIFPVDLKVFIGWKLTEQNGKTTKVPYSCKTGYKCSYKDKDELLTYEEALRGVLKYKLTGVGIVVGKETGIISIDVDVGKKLGLPN